MHTALLGKQEQSHVGLFLRLAMIRLLNKLLPRRHRDFADTYQQKVLADT